MKEKTNKVEMTVVVNGNELQDSLPGWYNPPYCLATWPLGNNSTVCCQSNTNMQSLRDAPASAHSSHRRERAREKTKLKLWRTAYSLTHTLSSITLNWFPSTTNGEGVSLFIYVRLNLEERHKWKEIEQQVQKKRISSASLSQPYAHRAADELR